MTQSRQIWSDFPDLQRCCRKFQPQRFPPAGLTRHGYTPLAEWFKAPPVLKCDHLPLRPPQPSPFHRNWGALWGARASPRHALR
jgi:hypothetical protein